MKVFVVGAGVMGSGIAQTFAAKGFTVYICDIKKEFVDKGIAGIQSGLKKSVEKGRITQEQADSTIASIIGTVDYADARDCDLVIEAAIEKMEPKKEIFQKLDAICSEKTIFATNTSSLSITEIASAVSRPEKFIGMHFFNPAPVMKLVELIRGIKTSDETFEAVRDIAIAIGKEPIQVMEGPGFVVNRVLIPMINEAVSILAEGLASAEDIDKALVLGANHPMGPLALSDLVGTDIVLAIMNTIYDETKDPKYRPHPLLRKMVRAGLLGRKTKQGFFKYN